MNIGDMVTLRAYRGENIERKVAHIEDGHVYVCREDEYYTALMQGRIPSSVGFPKEAVLRVEPAV